MQEAVNEKIFEQVITARNKDGKIPLQLATQQGQTDAITVLLEVTKKHIMAKMELRKAIKPRQAQAIEAVKKWIEADTKRVIFRYLSTIKNIYDEFDNPSPYHVVGSELPAMVKFVVGADLNPKHGFSKTPLRSIAQIIYEASTQDPEKTRAI